MAQMYYSQEEAIQKLGCSEDQLRQMVREGKLRQFRDGGQMTYSQEEVDSLAASGGSGDELSLDDSGPLSLDDSTGDIPLSLEDSSTDDQPRMPGSDSSMSMDMLDTSAGTGELTLEDSSTDSGDLQLDPSDSGGDADSIKLEETGDSGELTLEDTGGSGELQLEEVTNGSGELTLEDSGAGEEELKLEPSDSGAGEYQMSQSDEPELGELDLEDSGSAAGSLSLADSSADEVTQEVQQTEEVEEEFKLEDSGADSGFGALSLEDSSTDDEPAPAKSDSGADVLSLDEVDKEAAGGLKKDDTVITNIGISVFDDDDLEIAAADPMAKTLLTGGDDMALDGSGAGSGLLDLTRESDDTSLGAELLEGIDMGDTQDTIAAADDVPMAAGDDTGAEMPMTAADEGPLQTAPAAAVVPVAVGGVVEAASPAFTGLLIAAALVLALAGALNIANAMDVLPGYLALLAENFWMFLGGTVAVGGLFAGIGWFMGRQSTKVKQPKPAKEKKAKEKKVKAPKVKKTKKKGK